MKRCWQDRFGVWSMIGILFFNWVFKENYFPTCSIFKAKSSLGSFVWKSILWSRMSTPGLDRSWKPPSSSSLHSTTRRGDTPMRARHIRGPFRLVGVLSVVRRSFGCSLSRWMRVFVYLWQWGRNLGQFLRELPKVSEVATNLWVFLRCDWSPVSS